MIEFHKGYCVTGPEAKFVFRLKPGQRTYLEMMTLIEEYPKRSVARRKPRPMINAVLDLAEECEVDIRCRIKKYGSSRSVYEATGSLDNVTMFALRWDPEWGTRV